MTNNGYIVLLTESDLSQVGTIWLQICRRISEIFHHRRATSSERHHRAQKAAP